MVMRSEKMVSIDRDDLLSFLSAGSDEEAPGTDQIVGILKQMVDEMTATIADADAVEAKAVTDHDELVAAKKSEINALSKMIEVKLQRVGTLAVELSQMKDDLKDTSEALAEDSKFLLDLEKRCKNSAAEREAMVKTRQEEVLAITDTIKILNDDDALELFKKTLPGAASFLQVQSSTSAAAKLRRAAAADIVAHIPRSGPRRSLDLVELALRGKKVGFDKVLGMIDALVDELKKEQVDDDEKKEYCAQEFDKSDDKKKATEREISDTKKSIAKSNEDIASLTDEMKELEAGIKSLDADVTDATENRKSEHEDYEELMASDATAQEVLEFAKNRLNKFYNPKLYKAPPKRELSEEDRITVNMGGTLAPTAAPGGVAGTGIGLVQGPPPPPPEAGTAYAKKTEESGGVIAMIDLLIADLEKEMTEAKMEEKHAQEDYEQFLAESAEKRAKDSKSFAQKEAAHAEATSDLEGFKGDLAAAEKNLAATLKYIQGLHADCDFLVKYYDMRKEMRGKEVDGLVNAKAALHGATFLEESSGSAGFLAQQ
jgi:chromosome segregation ATPase